MIKNIPLLSSEECARVKKGVHSLKVFWNHRGEKHGVPFYTLGAASYLDAKSDPKHYAAEAKKYNIPLKNTFQWLYTKVAEELTKELGIECYYDSAFAYPGFHIFLGCKIFEQSVASLHTDLQFQNIDWLDRPVDFSEPLSATLSISLPSTGGGLNVWDLDYNSVKGLHKDERMKRVLKSNKTFCPYEEGGLVLHTGLEFHQIAPMKEVKYDDERITLQAHGVQCEGKYLIYW